MLGPPNAFTHSRRSLVHLYSCLSDVTGQTRETLAKIDGLLAAAGTSKAHVLSTQIWVKDITTDFAPMNEVWKEWVVPGSKGVRACVESRMARESILVEIKVTAALP